MIYIIEVHSEHFWPIYSNQSTSASHTMQVIEIFHSQQNTLHSYLLYAEVYTRS